MITATPDTQVDQGRSVTSLLHAVGEGDSSAWREIMCRYGKLVAATVRSFRLQDADALDAVQMTWLRLVEHHHQVRSPERLGGWLVTTARRECLTILRHAKRASYLDASADNLDNLVDGSADPEQYVVDACIAETLRDLVDELSPRQRIVLRALFVDGRSYVDISGVTGVPPGSIGPTRARALDRLRRSLAEHGAWLCAR